MGLAFENVLFKAKHNGSRIRRTGWNGKDQYVEAGQQQGNITEPFLVLHNQQGGVVPWVPSQGDLYANDWEIMEDKSEDDYGMKEDGCTEQSV